MLIPLSGATGAGKHAIIDDEDYEKISGYKWYLRDTGYVVTLIGKKQLRMHRLIMNSPEGLDTDHINRDRLDNRKSNLRICTRSQNNMNKLKPEKYKWSKYKGVIYSMYDSRHGTWKAIVKVKGKRYSKNAIDEIDAAKKYNELALQHHGEFALLNQIG